MNIPVEKLPEVIGGPDDTAAGWLMFDPSPEATQAWIEKYLTVPDENGFVVPFRLTPQQVQILQNTSYRDVTVKGRQTRASSIIMARSVRRMCTGDLFSANAVIGAQDDATTQAGFRARILHHIKDLRSKGLDVETGLDNDKELVITSFDNRFVWVSGQMATMSRGYSVQIVHLSEFAHWRESAAKLLGGVIPSVGPRGQIDLESTPTGEVGAFYDFAMKQSRLNNPDGLWNVHLYPWWLEARYIVSDDIKSGADIVIPAQELLDRERDFMPTEHEAKLIRDFGLTTRHMLWRRLKKSQQDATQAPFLQEFPESLDTCWVGTEGRFFDTPDGVDHLEHYHENRAEPVKRYENLPYKGGQVSFFGAHLSVWEFPDANDTYVGGFDAAGGGMTNDADYSVLYILSTKKEKIVAELRLRCSPKQFALMIAAVGTLYNGATINGEREARGAMVFEELRDLHYPYIYYYVDPAKPLGKNETAKPGMYPTVQNRQMVLERLKTAVTSHALESKAPELIREMNVFTMQKFQNRMRAAAMDIVGAHDDCIFAAAYGWFIVDKVRNRLRRERWDNETIVTGPLGRVIRRGEEAEAANKVWLYV